jgi:signal transduction histidine kinase
VIEVPKNIQISVQKNLSIMHGNAWRFKQVFQNLIQNAIKYNDKAIGKIEVVSVERKDFLEFFYKR